MYKGRDDLISPEEAEKGVEIVSKICGVDKEKNTLSDRGMQWCKHK